MMMEEKSDFKGTGEKWPKVAIIVLNWNGWRDTIECLESLYQITYPNYEVIVVDNGSEDESVCRIMGYARMNQAIEFDFFDYDLCKNYSFSDSDIECSSVRMKIYLIKTRKNHGFAGGSNIGIKYALDILNSDYILLLNNDTIVDNIFLDELVKTAMSNEMIGIVGSTILSYYNRDLILSAGAKISKITRTTKSTGYGSKIDKKFNYVTRDVDYVSGCAFMIKSRAIRSIGLLDERYFIYVEEKDWATRAKKSGYRCVYVPKSKIWHKESISSKKISGLQEYHMMRGQILYVKKFFNKWQSTIAIPIFFFKRLFFIGITGQYAMSKYLIKGLFDGLRKY